MPSEVAVYSRIFRTTGKLITLVAEGSLKEQQKEVPGTYMDLISARFPQDWSIYRTMSSSVQEPFATSAQI